MFCDNEINTLKTLLPKLTLEQKIRINFIIVEINPSVVEKQQLDIDKLKMNPEFETLKIQILEGDIIKVCKDISKISKNKFIYADTCGSEMGSYQHEILIKSNPNDTIIIGTYSQHDTDPKSYLGRTIPTHKTVTYEYGRKTIMKTYISIINKLYKEWLHEYILKHKLTTNCPNIDREDVIENKLPGYKAIEEYNLKNEDENLKIKQSKKKTSRSMPSIKTKKTNNTGNTNPVKGSPNKAVIRKRVIPKKKKINISEESRKARADNSVDISNKAVREKNNRVKTKLNGPKTTYKPSKKISLGDGYCKFPFIYKGKQYNKCIKNSYGDSWCASEVDSNNEMVKYALCDLEPKPKLNQTPKNQSK